MGLGHAQLLSHDALSDFPFINEALEAFGAGGDIHSVQNLTQREARCKEIIHVPLSHVQSIACGKLPAEQMSALDRFRENVRAYMAENDLTQRKTAENIGVTEQWLSQVLSGARGSRIPTIERVAAALADLFNPLKESQGVSSPDPLIKKHRASNPPPGDVHGIDPRLLESQAAELEKENAALRITIATLTDQYRDLVAIGVKARTTQKRKPALRKRRG